MSLTNYAESAILNSLFGKTSDFGVLASAPTLYIGLCASDPTDAGTLTSEPDATGGYARLTTAASDWVASSGGSAVSNATVQAWSASSAAWSSGASTLGFFFIADSDILGAGNMIASGAVTTPRAVNAAGVTLSAAIGALTATLD